MTIKKSILINSKLDELWAYLTEFERIRKWNPSMLSEEIVTQGKVEKGFLSKVLIKEGKRENWYESEILEYQIHDKVMIALKGKNLGKSPMYISYQIKEFKDQLELNYECNWKPVGFILRLLHPIIKSMSDKNAKSCLEALKSQLEN